MRPPLTVIAGATACGKTDFAIALAKRANGEIVSADSMQVYRYMDIGTAKPTSAQMQGVRHYLIDEIMPDEVFSVAAFTQLAAQYVREIYQKGKLPILVGGTGFYINAFLYGAEFTPTTVDLGFRESLYDLARGQGRDALFEMLRRVDPEACEQIHPNNLKRVVRAIEYQHQTGQKISTHNQEQKRKPSQYDAKFVVLDMPREKLYRRIEERVDRMLALGLADEVRGLLARGYSPTLTSMQGLGYKELVPYIHGEITLPQATDTLKRNTRRFAKRQITWFKNQNALRDGRNSFWINVDEFDNMGIMLDILTEKGGIVNG